MATPHVRAAVTASWTDVIGSAASVAGVTWQNLGPDVVEIAFTTSAPAGGASDATHLLAQGEAFYDKNGSAHCWVRTPSRVNGATICATAD